MSDTPLASLSLTHVHYDPSDFFSYISAWLALFPQGLCIVYTTLLLSTREIEIAMAFAGQLACEAFNWILKRLIKEQRPEKIRVLGKGYGMPSSHAQFVGYWAVYIGLWLWLRFSPRKKMDHAYPLLKEPVFDEAKSAGADKENESPITDAASTDGPFREPKTKHEKRRSESNISIDLPEDAAVTPATEEQPSLPLPPDSILSGSHANPPISPMYSLQLHHPHLTKALLTAILFSISIPVCFSRVYLGYHTLRQVCVGAAVGATCAFAWFAVTDYARHNGYVDVVLELPLLRSLRVRDLCCEDDLVELGWTVWEQKRKRRMQKRRKSVRFAALPSEDMDGGWGKGGGKKRKKKV